MTQSVFAIDKTICFMIMYIETVETMPNIQLVTIRMHWINALSVLKGSSAC